MTAIATIVGREILDSRGNPTVEVDVVLETAPSAAPRCPPAPRPARTRRTSFATAARAMAARASSKAVEAVNGEIRKALTGSDAGDQRAIDQRLRDLDGTENKKRLGANAILGVSLATAKAAARDRKPAALSLSRRRRRDAAAGANDEHPQWRRACRQSDRLPGVHDRAGRRAEHRRSRAHGRGDLPRPESRAESRRATPPRSATRAALRQISPRRGKRSTSSWPRSTPQASSPARTSIFPSIVAATEFYRDGRYVLKGEGRSLTAAEMVAYMPSSSSNYPIYSIEDGMSEDDWEGWRALTKALGDRVQLVGDDLFVTNVTRLKQGIDQKHRQRHPGQGQPDRHA